MKLFLKIVLFFLLAIALVISGLYIAVSIPKKVDVTWTEKDLQSYMKKAHADIKPVTGTGSTDSVRPASLDDLLMDNFRSTGKVAVNDIVTSAEATAMINTVTRANSLFKDVRMNFREDGTIEVSGYLGKAVDELVKIIPQVEKYKYLIKPLQGKPIYWRYSLERVENNKFDAHTLEMKVGQIPVPLAPARAGLTEAGSFLNDMTKKIDGFSCEQLKIDSQGFHFKGTLPEKLESVDPNKLLSK